MKRLWHFTLLLSIAGILSLVAVAVINTNITFSLKGDNYYVIPVNENFEDPLFTSLLFKKNVSNRVKITSTLNTSKIGVYYINYDLNYLGKNYNLKRKIEVIDNTKPDIKLNGDNEVSLFVNDLYIEQGATSFDNYDGDITSNIVISGNVNTSEEGTYEIIYSIKDSSGNFNSITRKVNVLKKKVLNDTTNNDYTVNNPIVKYIMENNYKDKISIGYYNLVTGDSFYYQENKIYYGASLIKTLDALYLYDNNLVTDEIKPYIEKAISISDNDSHYFLINYIGRNNLKNYGINLGAYNTLSGGDSYGNTTVMDQIAYLKKLYNLSKNNSALKSYFINDYGNYLKINDVSVMHKYGYYGSFYHDVGIFLDKDPYIVVVLTTLANDNERAIINNISNLIYDYHNKRS